MILRSGPLFPWLLLASLVFLIILIFSSISSSLPFSLKQPKQTFIDGWKPGCDLSDGRWVSEVDSVLGYANWTCKWLPESKNCGKYGKNGGYERWRWKPKRCEAPRFNATEFFDVVRGKRLAFVGDSVARNQADSLVCLLSQIETPTPFHKDPEERFPVFYFESHAFTLMVMWTKFLVQGTERMVNGSGSGVYDLQLDKIDQDWTKKLPFDIVIISTGHWFFRKIYIHEGGQLIGCIFCSDKNVTNIGLSLGVQKAFRKALQYLNEAEESDLEILTLLRTFSPAHFENGTWNDGGYCNRTKPFTEGEVNLDGTSWEIRNLQVEEISRIKATEGKLHRRFELLDITKGMMMRPDAHPDTHWNNQWMRGYSDCVHWCMPGAVDMWNDMLLILLKKYSLETGSTKAD